MSKRDEKLSVLSNLILKRSDEMAWRRSIPEGEVEMVVSYTSTWAGSQTIKAHQHAKTGSTKATCGHEELPNSAAIYAAADEAWLDNQIVQLRRDA